MEAIILAGGYGKRLNKVLPHLPKPMAPIGDKPFLEILLNNIIKKGVDNIILAVSYKSEIIKQHFGNSYKNIPITYSIESEPLGTGGAIKQALKYTSTPKIIVLNGDTFFDISSIDLSLLFENKKFKIVIALKEINNTSRYGTVKVNNNDQIISFEEKSHSGNGLINSGIYIVRKSILEKFTKNSFSFEVDVLQNKNINFGIGGIICKGRFIDIGIPSDYCKAQKMLI